MLDVPDEEILDVKPITVEVPAYARMFVSVTCSMCGENVMESQARLREASVHCMLKSGVLSAGGRWHIDYSRQVQRWHRWRWKFKGGKSEAAGGLR